MKLFSYLLFLLIVLSMGLYYYPEPHFRAFLYRMTRGDYAPLTTIDHVYIINLDEQVGRYQRTQSFIDGLELPAASTRFSAVNGAHLHLTKTDDSVSLLAKDMNSHLPLLDGPFALDKTACPDVDILFDNPTGFTTRFFGELGCFCSHRAVWKDMRARGYKKVLIVEDDTTFKPYTREILSMSLANLPSDWDILFLGLLRHRGALDSRTSHALYRRVVGDITSTEAYIITDTAADILLANSQHYTAPIDMLMSDMIVKTHLLQGYALWPRLSRQRGPSVISSGLLEPNDTTNVNAPQTE